MTVADTVGRTLAALGCRQVFGVVGSGNFVVTRALVDGGAAFTAARHETAAVTMADAWARVTGEVGVATVHQGPGFTNALTALAEAAKSRTPLLVLAGDTSAAAVRSNFRVDQAAMAVAVGAVPERIHTPATAVADVIRAHRRAELERRTVALMLPLDVQAAPDDPGAAPAIPPLGLLTRVQPTAEAVGAVANLLAAARLPAIVAGRGAVLSGARGPLEELAELTGAVVATSAVANGLFAGNRFSLGISGGFASPVAARLLAEADLVVAAGASLNMWTTRHGALVGPRAKVLQIDTDVDAIGAHRPVDLGIVGDVGATAEALVAALRERGHANAGFRTDEIAAAIAAGGWRRQPLPEAADPDEDAHGTPDSDPGGGRSGDDPDGQPGDGPDRGPGSEAGSDADDDDGDGRIDPRVLSARLHEILPAERTVAIDSGHFMGWPAMYLDVPDPQGFVFTQAFQSIGLGLASAIGAAIARPDRLTVAALGDGGALMAAGEIETVGRLGLPLLVVVYNDAAYGAEVHHFGPHGEPLDIVRFPDTDLAALGRAAGTEGVTVRHVDDLAAVERWIARWTAEAHSPAAHGEPARPGETAVAGQADRTEMAGRPEGPGQAPGAGEADTMGGADLTGPAELAERADLTGRADVTGTAEPADVAGPAELAGASNVIGPTDLTGPTEPAGGTASARGAGGLRPLVVDAKVDPTVVAEWLAEAFRAH